MAACMRKPPKPLPTSTTSSPGLSSTLRATWSALARCASSSVCVPFVPVSAGVEHVRIVEPELVELRRQRVVELRIALGPDAVRVGMNELVPAVAQAHEPGGLVGAAFHADGERLGQAPLDVQFAVEVGLEHADMPVERGAAQRPLAAEPQGERRRGFRISIHGAVREAHAERRRRVPTDFRDQ